MYESFFSLKVKPFDLLPNPEFLFLSRSHKKAQTYLDYAVKNRTGFIMLSGEIGSGKTTLIRDLFNKHHQKIVFSKVSNTSVNFEQLLAMINEDFGLPVSNREKLALLRELNDFLIGQYAQGKQTILIIDEAQNLTPETLEELRLLSNLETDSAKLLHIVLAGQPELRQKLDLPQLRQLRQRIGCFSHVMPLEHDEVLPYIQHRLACAGNRDAAEFTAESLDIIWRYSHGIPRLINIFCDFLLLLAFADGVRIMTPELTRAVVADMDFESTYWGNSAPPSAGRQVSNPPPAPEPVTAKPEPPDETIKDMLAEILNRVGHLEKAGSQPQSGSVRSTDSIPDTMQRYVQGLVEGTSQPTADVSAGQNNAAAPHSDSARKTETPQGKKRGWFGFLFRAV
jgi:putative secretion ATPase (PEP-CTERM system associated)